MKPWTATFSPGIPRLTAIACFLPCFPSFAVMQRPADKGKNGTLDCYFLPLPPQSAWPRLCSSKRNWTSQTCHSPPIWYVQHAKL